MDIETKISSCNLYHFTEQFETLKLIIENGIKPSYCLEQFYFYDGATTQIAIPMSCFCDIPFGLSEQHRSIYGKYGISLSKEWGQNNKICPIIYLPEGELKNIIFNIMKTSSKVERQVHSKIDGNNQDVNNTTYILLLDILSSIKDFWFLLMFTKPYSGLFEKKKYSNKDHKFYDEREWRYKPEIGPFSPYNISKYYLTLDEYSNDDFRLECNAKLPFLHFNITDIANIVVRFPHEKEEINKLIIKKFEIDFTDRILISDFTINE